MWRPSKYLNITQKGAVPRNTRLWIPWYWLKSVAVGSLMVHWLEAFTSKSMPHRGVCEIRRHRFMDGRGYSIREDRRALDRRTRKNERSEPLVIPSHGFQAQLETGHHTPKYFCFCCTTPKQNVTRQPSDSRDTKYPSANSVTLTNQQVHRLRTQNEARSAADRTTNSTSSRGWGRKLAYCRIPETLMATPVGSIVTHYGTRAA